MRLTMHLRPGVAKQPNLELKTRPKQLLGSLPLVIALPEWMFGPVPFLVYVKMGIMSGTCWVQGWVATNDFFLSDCILKMKEFFFIVDVFVFYI